MVLFNQTYISSWGITVLFVKNNNRSLRMCIDSHQWNKVTIKYKYPLPKTDNLFDSYEGLDFFKIDLRLGCHHIRV